MLSRTFAADSEGESFVLASGALAATWTIGGVVLVQLLPARRTDTMTERRFWRRRPVVFSLAVGALFALASLAGALVLRDCTAFGGDVTQAAGRVTERPGMVFAIALVAGAAEEVFFRIGLSRLLSGVRGFVISTILYTLATAATGNMLLVTAAASLGAVAYLALIATGRWYAPIVVHGCWSVALVGILPTLTV